MLNLPRVPGPRLGLTPRAGTSCPRYKIPTNAHFLCHFPHPPCYLILTHGTDKTVVRPLVCRHAAHYGCLLSWTEQRSNCPLCRRGLFYRRVSPRNRDSLRKFIVPFASGGFAISENLWTEWVNACGSDEEFSWVMGFHEFIDEEACWRFVRGE